MSGTASLFGVAAAALAYCYVGYPAAVAFVAALFPRGVKRHPIRPRVTVVVVAHDESETIGRRLRNLLALDYPSPILEIVVASDGSTDRMVEIARSFAAVRVVEFPVRRGKASV